MPSVFDMCVLVPDETLVNVVGNETVIMSLKTQSFFGLDEVGTQMWRALTSSNSIEDAFESLLKEYDVANEALRHDLETFVNQLVEQRLIELRSD